MPSQSVNFTANFDVSVLRAPSSAMISIFSSENNKLVLAYDASNNMNSVFFVGSQLVFNVALDNLTNGTYYVTLDYGLYKIIISLFMHY
jgi:hypothetical protein